MSSRHHKSSKKSSKGGSKSRRSELVPRSSPGRPTSLLPNNFHAVLRYYDNYQMTPGSQVQVQQFRLNSLNDPDFTGTGHQPMGYDQFSSMYTEWCVTACRVTIEANLTNLAANIADVGVNRVVAAFFATGNDTTVPTTVLQAVENHNAVFHKMTGYQNRWSHTVQVDNPRFFGFGRRQYLIDSDFTGQVGSNPTRWVVGNLMVASAIAGSATTNGNVEYSILLEFDTVFRAPLVLGTS